MIRGDQRGDARIDALRPDRIPPCLDTKLTTFRSIDIDVVRPIERRSRADALRCVLRDGGPIGRAVLRTVTRPQRDELGLCRANQLLNLDVRVRPAGAQAEPVTPRLPGLQSGQGI